MRDSLPLRVLKATVRALWTLEYGVRRTFNRKRYRLGGACGGCAKCCEKPTIRAGFFTWSIPGMRELFLIWQRVVNGFELIEVDEEEALFVFRCTHFDWRTRKCGSYASRPFMCRDYPRALLDQPWPVLFDACGFRPIARNAEQMRAALRDQQIPEAEREKLEKKLYLR